MAIPVLSDLDLNGNSVVNERPNFIDVAATTNPIAPAAPLTTVYLEYAGGGTNDLAAGIPGQLVVLMVNATVVNGIDTWIITSTAWNTLATGVTLNGGGVAGAPASVTLMANSISKWDVVSVVGGIAA